MGTCHDAQSRACAGLAHGCLSLAELVVAHCVRCIPYFFVTCAVGIGDYLDGFGAVAEEAEDGEGAETAWCFAVWGGHIVECDWVREIGLYEDMLDSVCGAEYFGTLAWLAG